HFGLTGREPFEVTINGRDDESPSLACENLPRQKVVLDSEQLTFQVRAQDDFGVKRVGIEWQGLDEVNIKNPAKGERILSAGGADRESLDLTGTFSAKAMGIEPQPIQLRLFVEDYFPDRPRVYSPTYVLYVLDPEQHAIWLTEQLSKWHRQSLEVRDRELQLHEGNKQLRELAPEQLDEPENRRKLDAQAGAERANGRRLSNLVESGEDLVRQAARNPEFGVGHLEKWAEMLQILKDISDNRMPSVADLLKQAAEAPTTAQSQSTPEGKQRIAGQVRASGGGGGGDKPEEQGDKPKAPNVPRIADVESTQLDLTKEEGKPDGGNKSKSTPRLSLPSTTLLGGGKDPESCPAGDKVDEAIAQQED
ncbi:MAG TPA: hypothetical protein PLV92_28735, partial [Pirellulaceae bacterium]|nr:hypothetical protein [Pirellulaceae bacterium]